MSKDNRDAEISQTLKRVDKKRKEKSKSEHIDVVKDSDVDDVDEIVEDDVEVTKPVAHKEIIKPRDPRPMEEDEMISVEEDEIDESELDEEDNVDEADAFIDEYNDRFSLSDVDGDEIPEEVDDSVSDKPIKLPTSSAQGLKVGATGERKSMEKFRNYKPSDKVAVVDDDIYQRALVEQYLTGTKGGGFTGPRNVSKTVLPYSGWFIDVSSYTNGEMLTIHEASENLSSLDKFEIELQSVYTHLAGDSLGINDLTYDDFISNIILPDVWETYYAIYNSNEPGVNKYKTKCDAEKCGHVFEVARDNADITFVSEGSKKDITKQDVDDILKRVPRDLVSSHKIAKRQIVRDGYLSDSKFKVTYGMPTVKEALSYLRHLERDLKESDEIINLVLLPTKWMWFNGASKAARIKVLSYKYAMYVRRLLCPVYENIEDKGKKKLKVRYVDAKKEIIPMLIESLSKDDFKELVNNDHLRKMLKKDGIEAKVDNFECPKCGAKQRHINLDVRNMIFTGADEMDQILTAGM